MTEPTRPPAPGSPDPKMEKVLAIIEPTLGHFFHRPIYLRQALQTPGSPLHDHALNVVETTDARSVEEGNKRLAVVGNAALELTVADFFFARGAEWRGECELFLNWWGWGWGWKEREGEFGAALTIRC